MCLVFIFSLVRLIKDFGIIKKDSISNLTLLKFASGPLASKLGLVCIKLLNKYEPMMVISIALICYVVFNIIYFCYDLSSWSTDYFTDNIGLNLILKIMLLYSLFWIIKNIVKIIVNFVKKNESDKKKYYYYITAILSILSLILIYFCFDGFFVYNSLLPLKIRELGGVYSSIVSLLNNFYSAIFYLITEMFGVFVMQISLWYIINLVVDRNNARDFYSSIRIFPQLAMLASSKVLRYSSDAFSIKYMLKIPVILIVVSGIICVTSYMYMLYAIPYKKVIKSSKSSMTTIGLLKQVFENPDINKAVTAYYSYNTMIFVLELLMKKYNALGGRDNFVNKSIYYQETQAELSIIFGLVDSIFKNYISIRMRSLSTPLMGLAAYILGVLTITKYPNLGSMFIIFTASYKGFKYICFDQIFELFSKLTSYYSEIKACSGAASKTAKGALAVSTIIFEETTTNIVLTTSAFTIPITTVWVLYSIQMADRIEENEKKK